MQVVRWKLKEIAEPQRWNARKIAEATGLAYNTVWGIWVNKSQRADLATIGKLCELLSVRPGDLIGYGDLEEGSGQIVVFASATL